VLGSLRSLPVCPPPQAEEADIEAPLARVKDKALHYSLTHGVGFIHEAMAPADREVVDLLFASGAIQARVSARRRVGVAFRAFSAQGIPFFLFRAQGYLCRV
jgi:hypothetical protein